MGDNRSDPHPDGIPEDTDTAVDSPPDAQDDDSRSDIEQAVQARSDAVARGEGGDEPEAFTSSGLADGVGGTGGEVKNQNDDAQ